MKTVRLGGAATTGFGVLALLGWALGWSFLASLGPDVIPMAPSTALLFVLYGIAVLLRARPPLSRGAHRVGVAVTSAGALVALLLLGLSFVGIRPVAERLGFAVLGQGGDAPVGHMSPVTAMGFLLASASFVGSLPSSSGRAWPAAAARWTARLLLAASAVLLLAYVYGAPLFYAGSLIPPAATTSLAFAALGAALLGLAARAARPPASTTVPPARVPYPLVLLFVLLAAGIVTGGGVHLRQEGQRYRTAVEQELSAVAELKTHELMQWRAERLGDAALFLGNAPFPALARRALGNPQDAEAEAQLRIWLTKVQTHYPYDQVSLLDARGAPRLALPEGRGPVFSVIARRVPEVPQSGQVAFEDFYRDEHDERVHLSVLVPLFDERRRALGLVVLRIDPATSLYPLINAWPTAARTAETLLVRRDGNDALFLNELKFQKHTALTLRIPLARPDVAAVKAVLGQEGIVEARDYRGVPVIAALRAVPGSPWFLVARMDLAEVNGPLQERLWAMIVLVGGLLAAAAAGVGLIWRAQQAREFRAHHAAEQERAWLHDVIARSLNEVYVFDPETLRFRFVNRGACRNIGYTPEELAGLTPVDIKPEFTAETFRALLEPLRSAERPGHVYEAVHRRKDGSEYVAEAHLQLVDAGPRAVFLCVVNDITERRRADTRIRHLNRVYAVLSDINQAIVRVREPLALFAEACRIAVETGGFRMAWVGLVDADTHGVRPVAHAGVTDGDLDRLPHGPGASPDGLGPGATGLRDGGRAVCNDIAHDPRMAAWRDAALARGYRAWAAFPLTAKGQTVGTVTLYASEPGVFDDEELRLLDELAADLALAMEMDQLEVTRRRLTTAIEQTPVAVVITDPEGRIDYVNPAFTRITGYAAEEALGGNPRMLKSGTQEPAFYRELWATIREGRIWHGELVNRRKDGSFYTQEQTIAPIRDAAGRPTHFVAIGQDVTARKRDEHALRLARVSLDHAADMILWVDREGHHVYANDTALRLLGYSREELLGMRLWGVALGVSPEAWPALWEATRETGSTALEDTCRRKDGSTFRVDVAVTHVALGETELQCAMIRDITARKEAEETLRRSHDLLDLTGRIAQIGGWDIDVDTQALTWTNEVYRIHELDPATPLSVPAAIDYYAPEARPVLRAAVQAALDSGTPWDLELPQMTAQGRPIWVRTRGAAERRDGRTVRLYGVLQDITERKRIGDEVQRQRERSTQNEKLAAMSTLLAGVAHELNNPLSVVVGRAALLRARVRDEALARQTGQLEEAAHRCARIVKNFLALARQQPPERAPGALNGIVREALEILAYPLRVDGVELRLDLAEDLPALYVDAHQLGQVVINLVSNAHHAVRGAETRRITVTTRHEAARGLVSLAVEDTGPGIPPAVERRLFEPFFTTKPLGQGTGLGLALCRGIVEEHGGALRVDGRPGRGARFVVELPVQPAPEPASAPESLGAPVPIPPSRILVVDDEPEVASLVAEVLAEDQHTVETVASGRAALERLAAGSYDAIVSDIRMPDLDGRALYQALEQRQPAACGRLIFLTGDTLDPVLGEFLRHSGRPYVMKPFIPEQLRRALAQVLRPGPAGAPEGRRAAPPPPSR